MKLSAPLKWFDHALLDYIFNPVVWNSKRLFRNDAADLATYSYFFGAGLMVLGGIVSLDPMIAILPAFIAYSLHRPNAVIRERMRIKTKDGRNDIRELWWGRIALLFLILFAVTLAATTGKASEVPRENIGSILSAVGIVIFIIIPAYFESTDPAPFECEQSESEAS